MELSAIGEFGLIERIRKGLGPPLSQTLIGIGDDAAIFVSSEGRLLIATTDLLIEGVHFIAEFTPPYALGCKAIAVNVSDIAAMGGIPKHALVSLALPPGISVQFVEELYRGLKKEAAAFEVDIIGGDTSSSSSGVVLAVAVLGEVEPGSYLTRSGAKAGDTIWVTGRLGASAAGLAALQAGYRVQGAGVTGPGIKGLREEEREALSEVIQAHLFPIPRVLEGRAIATKRLASAMIDVSDGLASDLGHICRESTVSAKVFRERLPLHPAVIVVGRLLGRDPLVYALQGGEDYELLFTSPREPPAIQEALAEEGLVPVTLVGEVVEGDGKCLLVEPDGGIKPLTGGYEHFRA